jgi:hypothetical protein
MVTLPTCHNDYLKLYHLKLYHLKLCHYKFQSYRSCMVYARPTDAYGRSFVVKAAAQGKA